MGDMMKIRLGYVAITNTVDNLTTSGLVTYTHYKKLGSRRGREKLLKISLSNIVALEAVISYNLRNNIHFYRLTSRLIPLATHPLVSFDYSKYFKKELRQIGQLINKHHMRVDSHPDQFCILNSTNEAVVTSSIIILKYHQNMFKIMNLHHPKIIIHIGSSSGGKRASLKRFTEAFNTLDEKLKKMIIVENDDKVYNIRNTLSLCHKLDIPMVLDYHHYKCCNNGEKIEDYIESIFATWDKEALPPKIHFASPRSKKNKRAHHDFINSDDFIRFIEKIKFVNRDFDIMIEAKMKDIALFKLVRELKYKTNYRFLDETTFEV
jgi:UV DNA damage endonuclease